LIPTSKDMNFFPKNEYKEINNNANFLKDENHFINNANTDDITKFKTNSFSHKHELKPN